jgi:3-deoxy-D-manno-octulosonate 8-phosphate phosphatase (KDO 8-P phosphatase)
MINNDNQDIIYKKALNIKLLILDVDGVLTDGRIIYTDTGEEMKFYDARDGHGIKLLIRSGIEVAIITGRFSKSVDKRAADLGIKIVYQRALNKIDAYEEILKTKNLTDEEICTVGDDLPDLPLARRSGLSFAVPESVEEVKIESDCITKNGGGRGAVREICEKILRAQGLWEKVTARYYA